MQNIREEVQKIIHEEMGCMASQSLGIAPLIRYKEENYENYEYQKD